MSYLKRVALTVMALTFSAVSHANMLVNGDFGVFIAASMAGRPILALVLKFSVTLLWLRIAAINT